MRHFLTFLFILACNGLLAQTVFYSNDFESGNLDGWVQSDSGSWVASSTLPINGSYSLRHNPADSTSGSHIHIALTNVKVDSNITRWRFNLKNAAFDPSAATKFWVYLFTHDTTLVNGYAVGVNLTGETDSLSLWRLTASVPDTLFITSDFDWGANSTVGVEVTRDSVGVWELKYDPNGDFDNLISCGVGVDSTYIDANYFGMSYYFKLGDAGGLWLDDVQIEQGQRVYADVAAMLEGPYDTGTMKTDLVAGGYLPLTQTYSGSAWNYNGSETVPSMPDSVVDWVLVQLRTGTDAASTVASRAGLLTKNGLIVDRDGVTPLSFSGVADGSYYIVVRHRNHLDVMSATAQSLNGQLPLSGSHYNFSSAQTQAYGASPMKEVATGVFGLYAGDANANGQVQNTDKNEDWASQVGSAGYRGADFNMNGQVQNTDKNGLWKANVGAGTQVPN